MSTIHDNTDLQKPDRINDALNNLAKAAAALKYVWDTDGADLREKYPFDENFAVLVGDIYRWVEHHVEKRQNPS